MRRRIYGTIHRMRYMLIAAFTLKVATGVFFPASLSDIAHAESAQDHVREVTKIVRTVTAYNVGVAAQNDSTPCIGASNLDLCRLVALGVPVCAANFVPLGTKLDIEGYGECYVLDRMARRHGQKVDIAMRADEIGRAREWGIQKLAVKINK